MPCADPESFVRGAPTLIMFFGCFPQLLRGKRASEFHPKAGHHRSTSETPVIWGRSGPPVPPLDPRMNAMNVKQTTVFVCVLISLPHGADVFCLSQGPQCNDAVRLEPAALRSRVKHSTTEPLCSRRRLVCDT